MNKNEETVVNVNSLYRVSITKPCMMFYMSALHNSNEIFEVIFPGEGKGADLGALRNDFLIKVLRGVRNELFEGNGERLLPKSIWGHNDQFKMAGAAIVHSLLQGGPAFSCINSAIYVKIVGTKCTNVQELPNVADIPQHAGTLDMLEFIDKVCIPFINCCHNQLFIVPYLLHIILYVAQRRCIYCRGQHTSR